MRVILLTPNPKDFLPIKQRIEFEKISNDVVMVSFVEEALAATPNFYHCIIVSESFTTEKNQIEKLAVKLKVKNPNCKFIIYAIDLYGINESLFDSVIKSSERDSYKLLFTKIKEYNVPEPKKGNFTLNHKRWVDSGRTSTDDSMYDCVDCVNSNTAHKIVSIPGPPATGNEVSRKGDPTTLMKCTGCGTQTGPWVKA